MIDRIALEASDVDPAPASLRDVIEHRAHVYIRGAIGNGTLNGGEDIDRVSGAIIREVLNRLMQIAVAGGQVGNA
jgi:hypothetical protein